MEGKESEGLIQWTTIQESKYVRIFFVSLSLIPVDELNQKFSLAIANILIDVNVLFPYQGINRPKKSVGENQSTSKIRRKSNLSLSNIWK